MDARCQTSDQPTILCVDDEPYILKALERLLRQYNCRVLLAQNGEEALGLLERERVEVMICDEVMPETRGIDVLRQAKVISPRTARILLTAHCCDEDVIIPAVNEGEIFRLLSKPWEDQEVQRAVEEALGAPPQEWSRARQRTHMRLREDLTHGL